MSRAETAKRFTALPTVDADSKRVIMELLSDHSTALEFVLEIARCECLVNTADCQCIVCRANTWLHSVQDAGDVCRCDCVNCVTGNHGGCYYKPSVCPVKFAQRDIQS